MKWGKQCYHEAVCACSDPFGFHLRVASRLFCSWLSPHPAALSRQGYHLIHWTEGGLAYWAISDLNEKELEGVGQLVRK